MSLWQKLLSKIEQWACKINCVLQTSFWVELQAKHVYYVE